MPQDLLLILSGVLALFLWVAFFDGLFLKWYSRKCGYDCAECKAWSCPGKRCRWQRMKEGRK